MNLGIRLEFNNIKLKYHELGSTKNITKRSLNNKLSVEKVKEKFPELSNETINEIIENLFMLSALACDILRSERED
jgi:hypothetical protein